MKTLLLNPPSGFNGKFVSREQCGIGLVEEEFLPSEIFLSAAYLQKMGHDVEAVDLDRNGPDFSRYDAAVVWVCVLHTFRRDIQWLHRAKEAGCRTAMILNDAHKNFEADTMRQYPFIDAAVRLWERELSLEALLDSWTRGTMADYPGLIIRRDGRLTDTGMHPIENDLSHLASSSQLLRNLSLARYQAAGITPGRGCTAGCGFCLYANRQQRKRPLEEGATGELSPDELHHTEKADRPHRGSPLPTDRQHASIRLPCAPWISERETNLLST